MGDPSGIGPSIIAKSIEKLKGLAEFIIIGDKWIFNRLPITPACRTGRDYPCLPDRQGLPITQFIDLNNVEHKKFSFGRIKAEYGRASIEYLDKALELIKKKKIDCLVTCPISKESINEAGFRFSGHTEYLAKKTNTQDFVMMLLNKYLKISLITRHLSLKEVPSVLTKDKIYKTILLTHKSLKELFLIKEPRIVVCGLNPHASDNGLLGQEENKIIKPALKELKTKIKNIYGPISADVAIAEAKDKEYDCVVAMYHDQALIPLKLLDKQTGVNITLGLPFIRTSPLHGTAFDIAANFNLANPASLIEAVKLALRCTLNLKNI
jgi:4-hydroxythreonine-4-phosphate dehydrogenase